MSLDLKEELAFFSRYNFHPYVGCSVWNIAFGEGLWTWTLILEFLTVLEFISNTERRWQEPWGPDIFRPNFFTAIVFTQIRFFCVFLYVLVPFARGWVFVSGISEFLFVIEEEHLQQLDSKLSFYKMVFITGKLFSASTSHAKKNFISKTLLLLYYICVHNLNFLIPIISWNSWKSFSYRFLAFNLSS